MTETPSPKGFFDRIPVGYSVVKYNDRTYGVTHSKHAGGKSHKVYAEELGGTDFISANLYLGGTEEHLRPCEMPAAKVVAFLEGFTAHEADPIADSASAQFESPALGED
ncbi:hypothetical protein K0651_05735 [Ornithinimicrobium sp. Arc0846-15]|nr:hypothetical protein [Ornithinimicrobium laminariae]